MENTVQEQIAQQPIVQESFPTEKLQSSFEHNGFQWSKSILITLGILAFFGVGLGGYYLGTKKNVSSPMKAQTITTPPKAANSDQASENISGNAGVMTNPTATPTPDPTIGWKTYTVNNIYTIKLPQEWYVYDYKDINSSIAISDIANPNSIPAYTQPDGHTQINIGVYPGAMPTTFAYTNGSSANSTIRPFSVNSYTGIRGSLESTLGLGENVILQNPKGGYIIFNKLIDNKHLFDQILSTFQFIK